MGKDAGAHIAHIDWSHMHGQLLAGTDTDKRAKWIVSMGGDPEAGAWLQIAWLADKRAWAWPERDDQGQIVGIGYRVERTGRKAMITGSKHGLIYAPDPEWGGLPQYIDHPILIVEGMTDVLACLSRNIYAIGRPSATGTHESNAWLEGMVQGQDIALVSENDMGVGLVAYAEFARRLGPKAKSLRAVDPPPQAKDIREWFKMPDAMLEIEGQLRRRAPWSSEQLAVVSPDVLTDTAPRRIAEALLAERYHHAGHCTLRYWNGLWYQFCDHHYERLNGDYVRAAAYDFLDGKLVLKNVARKDQEPRYEEERFNPRSRDVNEVVEAVRSLDRVLVPQGTEMPAWLDSSSGRPAPSSLVCFRNGILDLDHYVATGELEFHAPTPAWFSQTYCPHNFNPASISKAKPVTDFLNEIFNRDAQSLKLVQEWLGYALTSDTRFEQFLLMVGRPAAGKGTLLDIMEAAIGAQNICSTRLDSLGSRFGLFNAIGKSNIILPDAHVSQFDKSLASLEAIKTITGRGTINVEGKNLNEVSIRLNAKITMSVNELPDLHDSASALRRRLIPLWFPRSFEARPDPTLKDRLTGDADAMEGVIAWAMIGLRRLYARGRFHLPAASLAVSREFERVNSPITAFVDDVCYLDPRDEIEKRTLFENWCKWAREHGMASGNAVSFGQRLFAAVPTVKAGRGSDGGKRIHTYQGIRLRRAADPDT
jgi:putative DNA primase/helicase